MWSWEVSVSVVLGLVGVGVMAGQGFEFNGWVGLFWGVAVLLLMVRFLHKDPSDGLSESSGGISRWDPPPPGGSSQTAPESPRAQRGGEGHSVIVAWTRENCSSVSVTNLTLNVFRVRVRLNSLKRYVHSAGGFAETELAGLLPGDLVGGGNEAIPDKPLTFPFINTITGQSLVIHLHYPNRPG